MKDNNKVLARIKGLSHKFDFAMGLIWIGFDSHPKVGNYVLVHCMNHSVEMGTDYFSCENMTQLNDVKSNLINNGFSVDWSVFNEGIGWLNDKT